MEFTFSRRMEELGPRIFDATNDYSRILAGLRGELGVGWDFDAWVSYTRGEEEERLLNDASRSRMLQGLLVDPVTGNCRDLSNGCVPLNLFGAGLLSDDGVAFVRAPTFTNTTSRTQALASGFVRGPLLEAWAGPVNAAFGLEWRSDDGDFHADEALFEGDATGYDADSSVVGKESLIEVYAEAEVPLAENAPFARKLSLELGARYSEYDKAGSTDAFKAGAEWEPFDGLRFRAMWQRSVRAPDLSEAFQEPYLTTSYNFFVWEPADDLCSASADPVGQGNAAKCIEQGIPADEIGLWEATPLNLLDDRLGGNPELQPETAETVTIGAVYTGFENWSLAVDYYRLEVTDVIRQPDPYGACFARENVDGTLCDRIGRTNTDNKDFNVSGIDYTLLNQGESVVEGVDTQVNFGFELPGRFALVADYADLSFDLIWTWQWKNSTQDLPILEPVDCAGFFGYPCLVLHDYSVSSFPENRVSAAAQYISGNFDARVAWRWIEGTENAAVLYNQSVGLPPPELAIDSVDAKSYVDLSTGWRFSEQLAVRLQVSNLFGTDAPMMADAATGINTDTGFYDVFGRSYRLSASLRY